jgi:hypothetical protein
MKHTIETSAFGVSKIGERNDCAVRAATNVLGIDYDSVHSVFKNNGRKSKKGTTTPVFFKSMKELGFSYVGSFGKTKAARSSDFFSGAYFNVTKDHVNKSLTLGQFLKQVPFGKYVVCIAGHALAVVDGKIVDNTSHLPAKSQVVCILQYGEMV